MKIDEYIKFFTQYLSEYLGYLISTIKSPVLQFRPLNQVNKGQIILADKSAAFPTDNDYLRLNPKLLVFVSISIFLGITINALIPNRIPGPDFTTSATVIILFWIISCSLIHFICKALRGSGTYMETISVSLQIYSTLYVLSSLLALLFAAIVGLKFISNLVSVNTVFFDWIFKNPLYSLFAFYAVLYSLYLPLGLQKIHGFGLVRRILLGVIIILLATLGIFIGIAIYRRTGVPYPGRG